MKEEHGLNQCANDWITCKCGRLFSDSQNDMFKAKKDFLIHLKLNGWDKIDIDSFDFSITKE